MTSATDAAARPAAAEQLRRGWLVCPRTREALRPENGAWATADGRMRYTVLSSGVPVLLTDPEGAAAYAAASDRMAAEYHTGALARERSPLRRIKAVLTQDYRTAASRRAFQDIFAGLAAGALCVAVGGGPQRADPRLVNLNIGPFPNVDVVADAHALPYADGCVDAIHCEAVLEHLEDADRAMREMFRVLRSGRKAYFCTPFLQGYHGYPHHYRNYTLSGHRRILEQAGFRVLDSGTCVGPTYTLVSFVSEYLHQYVPRPFSWPLRIIWGLMGAALRPLDLMLAPRANAHVLASTTFVLVEKPALQISR